MKQEQYFNYKRFIPPEPRIHVDLIVRPLKLPRHTTAVLSQVDIDPQSLPFLVAKHMLDHMKKVQYIHRLHDNQIIGTPETRWRGGASEF